MRIRCFGNWSLAHLLALSLLGVTAHAQTPAVATLGGGTFNWDWTLVSQGSCPVNGNMQPVYAYNFTNFSATVNGVYTNFGGGYIGYIVSPGPPPYCPPGGPTHDQTFVADNYAVDFLPQNYGQGNAVQYNRGKFDPAYMVQSIIYSPPGDASSNSFTNSTTDGTSTSFGSSFTQGTTETVGEGFSFAGIGSTLNWIIGESQTQGLSIASTNTISNAASIGIHAPAGSNALTHQNDLFIIWLNPEITFQANSSSTGNYVIKTQTQGANDPEPGSLQGVDSVEVNAQNMVNGTVERITLQQQQIWDPNKQTWYSIPGLASICKNLNVAEYQAGQCTVADQCGCQPSDWTGILGQDVVLNYTNSQNVLNANTSPPSECSGTGLSANSKCRYVYVGQMDLLGPECVGCGPPSNSRTWTDSTMGTYTLSESTSLTTGYSWNVHFAPGGAGPTITNQSMLTSTSTESTGTINGYAHSAQVTLESNTLYCNEPVLVYMDTTYHTFLFQEAPNGTCP